LDQIRDCYASRHGCVGCWGFNAAVFLIFLLAGSAERWIVGRIVFFRRNLGPLAAWSKALAKFWILRIVRVFRLLLRLAVMQVAEAVVEAVARAASARYDRRGDCWGTDPGCNPETSSGRRLKDLRGPSPSLAPEHLGFLRISRTSYGTADASLQVKNRENRRRGGAPVNWRKWQVFS